MGSKFAKFAFFYRHLLTCYCRLKLCLWLIFILNRARRKWLDCSEATSTPTPIVLKQRYPSKLPSLVEVKRQTINTRCTLVSLHWANILNMPNVIIDYLELRQSNVVLRNSCRPPYQHDGLGRISVGKTNNKGPCPPRSCLITNNLMPLNRRPNNPVRLLPKVMEMKLLIKISWNWTLLCKQ